MQPNDFFVKKPRFVLMFDLKNASMYKYPKKLKKALTPAPIAE